MIVNTQLRLDEDKNSDEVKSVCVFSDSIDNTMRYGLIIYDKLRGVRSSKTAHITAYLNLPKADWHKINDVIRDKYSVTFEGVESPRVSIGRRMESRVPIPVTDFWIGIDYMNRECTWQEAVSALSQLCQAINNELRRLGSLQ